MHRVVVALAAVALLAGSSPTAAAPPGPDGGEWSAALLTQTMDVPALATGVAVGPSTLVAMGGMTCERTKSDDFGRCWGQPWISRDGATWEAVDAPTSGLELGHFQAAMSGPEVGLGGVAYGPGGFVAFGWAESDRDSHIGTGPRGLSPALWRSAEGASWERLPTPDAFVAEGPMISGALPVTIVGTETGYLLGGALYDTPAPRGAIWSSPDGLDWTLAGPDVAFDIGGYVDTMEMPAAGAIVAIAVAPTGGPGSGSSIAVGDACPGPTRWARPKGAWARAFEWTPGDCAARIWRSSDGLAWTADHFRPAAGADLAPVPYGARSVATTGESDVIGVEPHRLLVSSDGRTWDVARGPVGRHLAVTALDGRFYALVPECANDCRRQGLELWWSDDGLTWSLHPSQPAMPVEVLDFTRVDMAVRGDRLVVSAGFFAAPDGELASMALLSPPLTVPAGTADPSAGAVPEASSVPLVTLPAADAPLLTDTTPTPDGRLAYVTGAFGDRPTIHVLDMDTGEDRALVSGTQPSWSPNGAIVAYDCLSRGSDVATSSICTLDVGTGASGSLVNDAWDPTWSPDGSSLAYSASRVDMGDAWVRYVLPGFSMPLPGSQPQWSPSGDEILTTTGSGVPSVTVLRPDGTEERTLGAGWLATWSPGGDRIASAWLDGDRTTISAVDVEAGATEPLFAFEGPTQALAWLPDDTFIVTGGADGGDLYAVDLASGSARALTSTIALAPDFSLAVSPDGRWLAFGAAARDGRTDVYLASVEGGWRQLTSSGDASLPAWAP